MDNINKVSRIDTNLSDSSYRGTQDEKKLDKTKATKTSFSDIYDIRLLSAQIVALSSRSASKSISFSSQIISNPNAQSLS